MQKVELEKLRLDIMPRATKKAFLQCTEFLWLRNYNWYLAGGTALALQVGHRVSVDLDFFTKDDDFSIDEVEKLLLASGNWTTTLVERGTLFGILNGAKVSFITYPFFRSSPNRLRCGAVTILHPKDIAAMKIIAVSQRGRKRDFVDLYWLAHNLITLEEAIRIAVKRYPEQHHSLPHFLKSLVYFTDAENDPMPKIFFSADWKTVKSFFQKEVPVISKKLLKLGY